MTTDNRNAASKAFDAMNATPGPTIAIIEKDGTAKDNRDLLPLQPRETDFLRFWRAFPSLSIEEAAKEHAADMVRRAPWFGEVTLVQRNGSEIVVYHVNRATREAAYTDCLNFVHTKPAYELFSYAIIVAPRREIR